MSTATGFTEGGLEDSFLRWLGDLGWEVYGLGTDSSAGGEGARALGAEYERAESEIAYWPLLREQLLRLNPDDLNERNVSAFLTSLKRDLAADGLMEGNRAFHELLRRGKKFNAKHANGTTKPTYVRLLDFERPGENRFIAVNQMRVARGGVSIRPDVTLLVNGLPLVQIELKSLAQDNDFYDAISDLRGYEEAVPRLFAPALLNVAADTEALRYGAVGAPPKFYLPWSEAPPEYQVDGNPLRQSVQALLNPDTLLDLVHHFVFYEKQEGRDAKIVPRHMQYYAVQRLLRRIEEGDSTRGLVWHTQGSGKSYTMLYAARNLLVRDIMDSPQMFVVVDTDKLASQMQDDLANIGFERSAVAGSIQHLQQLIEDGQSQLVLTTVQKFQGVAPGSQSNPEVVVLTDEAHRFMEKDLGSRLAAALPDAYHFGFTGTPVHEGESELARNTFREFSPDEDEPMHRYSIRRGIEDKLILPVYFSLRHEAEWDVDEANMDEVFDETFQGASKDEKLEIIRESFTPTQLAELKPRVKAYAQEVHEHFRGVEENGWKGMVVTPSREAAALYGELLLRHRDESEVAVLYTSSAGDSERVRRFHTTSEERDALTRRFRREDNPKLLVVHNMLLTGFDAPVLKTMYLDRNLKDHTLLQAIARTNRPAAGKNNGEIVDFQGVFENIDEALRYDQETKAFAARDKDQLLRELRAKLEELEALFAGIYQADTQEALQACLGRVSKHPAKREFKQGYRQLQDLYESVSPDRRLIEASEGGRSIQDRYRWLTRVFVAFRRVNNRDENPENEVHEKTRKIIEEHVDVSVIKEQFPVYKIGEEHLERVTRLNPAAKANAIAHAMQDHLRLRSGQNPRYERLSERVREVVERWQSGDLEDPDAVDALERLEQETLNVGDEADERGLSEAEFAVYATLTGEYAETVGEVNEAEAIARDVCHCFEEKIDTDYPGWRESESTRKAVDRCIVDVLVKEHARADLFKTDGLVEDVHSYLIANYA